MRIDSILTHIIHSWSGIDSFAWKWLKRADSWFLRVYFKAVCSITKAIARGLNSTVHLPRLMDFLPQNGWLRTAMAMGPILRAGRGSNDLLNCVNNSAIWKCVSRCQSNVSKAPFNSFPVVLIGSGKNHLVKFRRRIFLRAYKCGRISREISR